MNNTVEDKFIGFNIEGYKLIKKCGEGAIGKVYYGKRNDEIQDDRAMKFIPFDELREEWDREINKVTQLQNHPNVVRYITHGDIEVDQKQYRWIAWRYINGNSLREIITTGGISIPILIDVIQTILKVLFACGKLEIEHGDLHTGNVLIERLSPLMMDQEARPIWITDFGYLSRNMGRDMLDDYHGLHAIIKEALGAIDFHALEGREKYIYHKIKREFCGYLQEHNHTEGDYVRDPRRLNAKLNEYLHGPPVDDNKRMLTHFNDYLAAEVLGNNFAEWRNIFVPRMVGLDRLLSSNFTILTGLRGCGKTTIFRRLTAIYDAHLGPSNVPGSESFIGFYFNARAIAEAFPWLPESKLEIARPRIIHHFNVSIILEILEWLILLDDNYKSSYSWLIDFFNKYYSDDILITKGNESSILYHLKSFFSTEKERSHLSTNYDIGLNWQLSQIIFLDNLVSVLKKNIPAANTRIFIWIDDYSLPLVSHEIQSVLNTILFRRSPEIIFKLSTESIESIDLIGLHGKTMQQNDDFCFVDLGYESLQRESKDNLSYIIDLLEPRLKRDSDAWEKKITIEDMLGNRSYSSYNQLARILASSKDKQAVFYDGIETLCDIWSSSTREIIVLFAEMLNSARDNIKNFDKNSSSLPLLSSADQNKIFRDAGGRFRRYLAAAEKPDLKSYEIGMRRDSSFGEHLQRILDAFCEICNFELLKTSKNRSTMPPKQARRLEIIELDEDLDEMTECYYKALLRYGVFIGDARGKSARAKAVPRMYLRSVLIPYYTLSFSKRDNIMMKWSDFKKFLMNPTEYKKEWMKKPSKENPEQMEIFKI